MSTPGQEPLADVYVGHHPDYGIVATNPKRLPASDWMLERLDFRPVLGEPDLYALSDQDLDGPGRATRAVKLLRSAGFRVDTDAVFNPSLKRETDVVEARVANGQPNVAFAEHPRLGVAAAVDDHASPLAVRTLLERGWRHEPSLDVYALPASISRDEVLRNVADSTLALDRGGVRVAVHPRLAQDILAHRPAPTPSISHDHVLGTGTYRSSITDAALATSPAASRLPGKAPAPAPAASTAAAQPIDPRIAFSRTR